MPIDPDDVFFLSATEFWFQSGLVTHNTSHIRLGTGVTPIPTYCGTTITVDPYFPEAAYPIWGLDGLGWTRYSTPVIDRTSLDTRVYGSGTPSTGGEVRLDAGRLQMWADDGTPTFDSEDSRQYLTDVYTGSITIPEVNGGSGGAGGTRLWDVSGGPVRAAALLPRAWCGWTPRSGIVTGWPSAARWQRCIACPGSTVCGFPGNRRAGARWQRNCSS
uniref:hypothetical protein n=1 Tax=Stappia sp. TaxID=1870903 RepID=UPI003BAB17B2